MDSNPDKIATSGSRLLSYALFHCDPLRQPPFTLELGFSDKSILPIPECSHIPDAIEKLERFCWSEAIIKSPTFTLLYPIYLEAMDTDDEMTMHNVAWLIKEEADKNTWNFGRIGGYTGKSASDFIQTV